MSWSAIISRVILHFVLLSMLAVTSPATAQSYHAVIVAVTEYPSLPHSAWLRGPANDARLVETYLLSRSPIPFKPENIKILADNLTGATEPSRAAVVAALEELAGRVEQGDFVYIHISGHGSQQPSSDPSETDGLDEIILPKDISVWDEQQQRLPNVLTDDEIGTQLDAIRARGAFVWVVFDTCNSGTASRAVPVNNSRVRTIAPSELGLPPELSKRLMERAAHSVIPKHELADRYPAGGMVAFFAAQSNESTPEMPLPQPGAPVYGLFTYTLFSQLGQNPNVTYRQLADSILRQYAILNRNGTTPLFEGDLDKPVFGSIGGDAIRQWPINVLQGDAIVQAGYLDGLADGTRLAVIGTPTGRMEEAIGVVEVKKADAFTSELALEPSKGDEPASTEVMTPHHELQSVTDIPQGSYARLLTRTHELQLRVARPPGHPGHTTQQAIINAALDRIQDQEPKNFKIEIVEPGETADLRLAVLINNEADPQNSGGDQKPRLWFLPSSGEIFEEIGRTPPSLPIEGQSESVFRDNLSSYLENIYRAIALFKISQSSDYSTSDVDVQVSLRKKMLQESIDVTGNKFTTANPGDRLRVQVTNNTQTPVDMNLIYIGSDYSIMPVEKERLQPSARYDEESLEFTDTSYGQEFLLIVLTEAQPLTRTLDLSFLSQDGLRSTDRGKTPDSIEGLIRRIAASAPSRAVVSLTQALDTRRPHGSIGLFPIRLVPQTSDR